MASCLSPSITGKMTLRITCDGAILDLFLDGKQQQQQQNSNDDFSKWDQESTFDTSDKLRVIAVSCRNQRSGAGVLASLENYSGDTVFYTNTKWKCSSVLETDWQLSEFQASSENWQNAVKTRDRSKNIGQISPTAVWIWSVGNLIDTVYCRGEGITEGEFMI